jgi:hypothetical protein
VGSSGATRACLCVCALWSVLLVYVLFGSWLMCAGCIWRVDEGCTGVETCCYLCCRLKGPCR